ncbi:MAG: hypothetical protein QF570_00520 [Myxococcota bacterium]|jgi:membrane protein implicated in regulation of membrane protease activity|nr:hypothetical protein [Myxococcota bacterium]
MNEPVNVLLVWMLEPQFWVILGLALMIADIYVGLNFFVLPVGVACFILALLLYAQDVQRIADWIPLSDWRRVSYVFAGLSVVSVGLVKAMFQSSRSDEGDINEY